LDTEEEIASAWKMIGTNVEISAKEIKKFYKLKKHKLCFDEGCSKLLDQRNQLNFCGEINGDNRNSVRREASGHFRNKKREYLKDRINELVTNSKNKKSETCIEE
jgi:hypothetical protein